MNVFAAATRQNKNAARRKKMIKITAAKKQELAEKLDKVLIESGDPRMQPGLCPFERMPFTVSYQ